MNFADLKIFTDIPTIESDRIILRKILRTDVDDVFEYSSDEQLTKYLLWHPHKNIAVTLQYLKTLERKYRKMEFYDWGVVHKSSGKLIGTCGFTAFDIENNGAEIGYVIARPYWGMGFAAEAARAVIEFGFQTLRLHRIEARFMTKNDGSRRVAQKCGMKFQGLFKEGVLAKGRYEDVEIFAVTEYEYKSQENCNIV